MNCIIFHLPVSRKSRNSRKSSIVKKLDDIIRTVIFRMFSSLNPFRLIIPQLLKYNSLKLCTSNDPSN